MTWYAAHHFWNRPDVYCLPRSELSRIRLNSDAGSHYTSIKFTETVALEGLVASIGTIGDAYDNAAAEKVMGLYNENSSLYVLGFTSELSSLKQAMHMNARRTQREGV